MYSVSFQNGNKEVTLSISSPRDWESGDKKRVYYDVACDGKRTPVRAFYKIVSGGTRDEAITINGESFGFEFGIDSNSKSKKEAVREAMRALVSQIA